MRLVLKGGINERNMNVARATLVKRGEEERERGRRRNCTCMRSMETDEMSGCQKKSKKRASRTEGGESMVRKEKAKNGKRKKKVDGRGTTRKKKKKKKETGKSNYHPRGPVGIAVEWNLMPEGPFGAEAVGIGAR